MEELKKNVGCRKHRNEVRLIQFTFARVCVRDRDIIVVIVVVVVVVVVIVIIIIVVVVVVLLIRFSTVNKVLNTAGWPSFASRKAIILRFDYVAYSISCFVPHECREFCAGR